MKAGGRVWLVCVCLVALCSYGKESWSSGNKKPTKADLDAKYRSSWESYGKSANTAANERYLSVVEKDVFYYLNLARINPPLFAETYASGYMGDNGWVNGYAWDARKRSLMEELKAMKPLPLVVPDTGMYGLASCFAGSSGRRGMTGHDRTGTGCAGGYNAECCHYGGVQNGLSIVMCLLIDAGENNANLGHRRICLKNVKYGMGVAVRPHARYKVVWVLDFAWR